MTRTKKVILVVLATLAFNVVGLVGALVYLWWTGEERPREAPGAPHEPFTVVRGRGRARSFEDVCRGNGGTPR